MRARRRSSGRRGSGYRVVRAAAVLRSLTESTLRRQLIPMSSASRPASPGSGQQVITSLPPDVDWFYRTGRPMPELFGLQDLSKYCFFCLNLYFSVSCLFCNFLFHVYFVFFRYCFHL